MAPLGQCLAVWSAGRPVAQGLILRPCLSSADSLSLRSRVGCAFKAGSATQTTPRATAGRPGLRIERGGLRPRSKKSTTTWKTNRGRMWTVVKQVAGAAYRSSYVGVQTQARQSPQGTVMRSGMLAAAGSRLSMTRHFARRCAPPHCESCALLRPV